MKINNYLSKSTIFSLFDAHQSLLKVSGPLLKTEGLSFMQSLVLIGILLEGDKEVTPKDLCSALDFSKAGISHIISKLEAKKLIKRSVKESDARGIILVLSKKGVEKANKLVKIIDHFEKQLEDQLKNVNGLLSGLKDFKSGLGILL